jgi:hypothetical protein
VTDFIWIFASFGLAYILGHAVITQAARELAYAKGGLLRLLVMLVECPACCGFWIGEFTGYWMLRDIWTVPLGLWGAVLTFSFVGGFFVCATNYVLARWTGLVPSAQDEQTASVEELGLCSTSGHNGTYGIHAQRDDCDRWYRMPDFRGRST